MYERLVRNGVVVDPPLYRGGSLGEASGSVPSDTTGEAADQVSDLPGQKTDQGVEHSASAPAGMMTRKRSSEQMLFLMDGLDL